MAIIEERPITLLEDDAPDLAFLINVQDPTTGAITPYPDFATKEFRFIVRDTEARGDTDPNIVTYESVAGGAGGITKTNPNKIVVAITPAATAVPGEADRFRYYIQVMTGTRPRTIRRGAWIVEDK